MERTRPASIAIDGCLHILSGSEMQGSLCVFNEGVTIQAWIRLALYLQGV